jgi:DNA polymerase-3 subunit epsilon
MLMMNFACRYGPGYEEQKIVDVQKIFHLMEQRTLRAYKLYCNKVHNSAHSAGWILSNFEIFHAQLERYPDLGNW